MEQAQRVVARGRWLSWLLAAMLLLGMLGPLSLAPRAASLPEPSFHFGSSIHPEDIYYKPAPTRLDLSRPGLRTPEDLARQVQAARQAGLTMLRGGWPWDAIAPATVNPDDPQTWHWELQDSYLATLERHGIEPLLLIHYGVPWLADPVVPGPTAEQVDQFVTAFARYAGETARRFGHRVRYYNIWNEPSLSGYFWSWSRTDFARLLVEASHAIKTAEQVHGDGDARVLLDVHALDHLIRPSLSNSNQGTFATQVLDTVVRRGDGQLVQTLDAVDLIAGHSYPDRTGGIPERLLGYEMAYYYTRMDDYLRWKYGARGVKQFMHTETGWSTMADRYNRLRVSEAKQAALLTRAALNLMISQDVPKERLLLKGFVQYDIHDDNPSGDYEGSLGLLRYYPVGDALDPKPSYQAQRLLIEHLSGARFSERRPAGAAHVYGFLGAGATQRIWALWLPDLSRPTGELSTLSTLYTLQLDPAVRQLLLVRLDGSTQLLTSTTGEYRLTLTEMPVLALEALDGGALPPTATARATATPTATATTTPAVSATPTATATATPAVSATPTATATATATGTPPATATPGARLTAGLVASASNPTSYNLAAAVLDDNRWTSWQTEYDLTRPSAWLRVDLPGPQRLGKVRWFITNGGLAPDYDVEALAADGQTWVALPDATGLTAAAGASWDERVVALEARAVRFTFRNVSPKPVPRLGSIGSVELYAGGGE